MGCLYSITLLPSFWQAVSQFNPIIYMVNGFRYGFIGVSDIQPMVAMAVLLVFNAVFFTLAWYLLKTWHWGANLSHAATIA